MIFHPDARLTAYNGKDRQKAKPNVVIHDTGKGGLLANVRYCSGPKTRYAGYHCIVDDKEIAWLQDPKARKAYHSAEDNSGIGLAMAYNNVEWSSMSFEVRDAFMLNLATAVRQAEERCGFRVPRVYRGDINQGYRWKAAVREGSQSNGFWGHGDQQDNRTDPRWSQDDWDRFMSILVKLDNPVQSAPVRPAESAVSGWAEEAWQWSQNQGFLDGTRPKDPVTREELATVLQRYSRS